jgi:DNA-binding IclR family transcriptional regulator
MPPKISKQTPLTQGIAAVRLMVDAGHSLGVTNIAKALDMPKSSVHRLLQSLCEIGFVQQLPNGNYTLSPDIFEFVHEIALHYGKNLKLDAHIRKAANQHNCSVYISMLGKRDTYTICAAGEEGNTTRLGLHTPAYSSSVGKVLISYMDPSLWLNYAPEVDQPEQSLESVQTTPYTILDPSAFLAELKEVRQQHVAWNIRESDSNYASIAMALREPCIPLPRLAVALVFPYEDFKNRDREKLTAQLAKIVKEMEYELGSR